MIRQKTFTVAKTASGPMEYRLEGRGPTVVVLNGGHCSRDSRLSHENLADYGCSVLTLSRPGYDGTPDDVGQSAQAAADALAVVLDTLKIPVVNGTGIFAANPSNCARICATTLSLTVASNPTDSRW